MAETAAPPGTHGRWPSFYIVGAPRCGTTYLYQALRRHPRVFMPFPKEPLFFCRDLDTGTAADRREFVTSESAYLDLFAAAPADALVGEACVFNLFSSVAAGRIRAAQPDARILICLRQPVEQLVSFHAVRISEGQEELPLAEALAAEPERQLGRRLPDNAVLVPTYQYRSVASYAAQVERYLLEFGRDKVLILFHDDLVADPRRWLDAAEAFLELEPGSLVHPGVVNAEWRARWPWVTRLTRSQSLIGAAKRVLPARLHPRGRRAAEAVGRLNRRRVPSSQIDGALRSRLEAELRPDVARLGELIGSAVATRWQ